MPSSCDGGAADLGLGLCSRLPEDGEKAGTGTGVKPEVRSVRCNVESEPGQEVRQCVGGTLPAGRRWASQVARSPGRVGLRGPARLIGSSR